MRISHGAILALALAGAISAAAQARQDGIVLTTTPCEAMKDKTLAPAKIVLPTGGVRVTSAVVVAATATEAEHCRLEGSILPVDPAAPPINFALAVPKSWRGASWQVGGGGVNGSIPRLTTTGMGNTPPGTPSLLTQGFAVYGGDSGHQGQGTDWVRNRESWMNFSYEQLKKTHDAAQGLLEIMSGTRARRSYFSGTSQGGREGLEVVARYPADYDGVIANVPLAYFQGLMIDPTIKVQTQAQPGAWIQPAKYPLLTQAVLTACDAMDGQSDGVISNYVGCSNALDPSVTRAPLANLRCPSGGEGEACLSDAQLATFNSLHGPVSYSYQLPNGKRDWPGWSPGADTALLSREQPVAAAGSGNFGIGAGVQRQLFGGAASYNLHEFSLDKNRARLEALSREVDVPADWSAFFARGGKLIMITAGADTISNPRAQMRLYDEVVKTNGRAAVDRAVRYYVVPFANHGGQARSGSGEVQPTLWDPVAAVRGWVERGTAPPDAPVMSAPAGAGATMTRPLCRYPAYPHFTGGDPTVAASYACRA